MTIRDDLVETGLNSDPRRAHADSLDGMPRAAPPALSLFRAGRR
jgi:hypothetical protein